MTKVLDLDTGQEQYFSVPPCFAVIAAYEQSRGNWNSWDYPQNHPLLRFGQSGQTVFCGSFGSILSSPSEPQIESPHHQDEAEYVDSDHSR